MAERGGGTFRAAIFAMICVAGLNVTCAVAETATQRLERQQPSLLPSATLAAFDKSLNDTTIFAGPDLIAQSGVADVVRMSDHAAAAAPLWATRPEQAAEAQTMNLRLALTMLTQAYGSDDVSDVLLAQPSPDQPALVIRKGTASLSDLRRMLRETRLQKVSDTGPLFLQVPLVIWSGAALHLEPDEVIQLSRADGVFVVNFGLMQLADAAIVATKDTSAKSPVFTPFLVTADGGVLQADGARFEGLGFGRTQKFSGLSIMQGTVRSPRQPSWIENSVLDGVMTLSVSMAHDTHLRSNHFRNMRGPALRLSRSMDAVVALNVFSGRMRTNAIIVEDGATHAQIAGNIILGGTRAGVVVRASSSDAVIADNIVWQRDGGGIALIGSDCAVVRGNLVIGNAQKGIEVRSSADASVTNNAVLRNHSAGIWVSAQDGAAVTFVRGNTLAENGAGVAAAAGGAVLMADNDFSYQYQQFLSGDLATQTPHMARDMRGKGTVVLTAGGPLAGAPPSSACGG